MNDLAELANYPVGNDENCDFNILETILKQFSNKAIVCYLHQSKQRASEGKKP